MLRARSDCRRFWLSRQNMKQKEVCKLPTCPVSSKNYCTPCPSHIISGQYQDFCRRRRAQAASKDLLHQLQGSRGAKMPLRGASRWIQIFDRKAQSQCRRLGPVTAHGDHCRQVWMLLNSFKLFRWLLMWWRVLTWCQVQHDMGGFQENGRSLPSSAYNSRR